MFSYDPDEDLVVLAYLHDEIIAASGGATGFHDVHLVQSALARPLHTAFEEEVYPDLFLKAAALLDAIANNHGFRDGNKRTAMAAASLYLYLNNIDLKFTNSEYESFMLQVVNEKPTIQQIKSWLLARSDIRI